MIRKPRAIRRGFTLLETLVTLVIVALVAGLVSQGLFQLARIERVLASSEVSGQPLEQLYQHWLVDTLRGLVVTGPTPEEHFHGNSVQLRGTSTQAPTRRAQGLTEFSMALLSSDGGTSLWLELKEIGADPFRVRLAQWAGQGLHWQFEDDAGQSHDQWPPREGLSAQALPRLIRLEQGKGQRLLLVAAPLNNYRPWVPLKDQDL